MKPISRRILWHVWRWKLLMIFYRARDFVTHPLWLLKARECERSGHVWGGGGSSYNWEFGQTEYWCECQRCGLTDSSL